ncbi:hypothetical protein HWV62_899 [Athelia sp. TMB]|nr:hypothetical protein HWV62_899 [Athelia sp. TMB]
MDVIKTVRECLASWAKGGESECCADVLTTAYHTLLCSTLRTWAPAHTLAADAFLAFVRSVLHSLPSASSTSATGSSNLALFGEIIVDMIWSIDAELEEVQADAKVATASDEQSSQSAAAVRQAVESDKETLAHIIKQLLVAGTIDPRVCRERLDLALVCNAGLVADKLGFEKKEVRAKTSLFYKQNKFNLLREQSEGYSKLTTELTSSLGPAHNSATGYPAEPFSSIVARARPVWEKVISLIGYFDLDPNRALDIILDVLSVHLSTHYSFFLALLSFSPWCGAYKRSTESCMASDPIPEQYKDKTIDEILVLAETQRGREQPSPSTHPSSHVMAQVLGFKFAYYQSPDVSESAPKSLHLTAALLIREGFIALEDLYPHLSPDDTDMDKCLDEYNAKVKERISGAKNSQLAMAAPLEATSTPSSSKPQAAAPSEPKKPTDIVNATPQKVGLLSALLALGALRPAIAILSKFPWLVDAYPEIADLMIRVMKQSISSLYESTMVTKGRNPSFAQPRSRYGSAGVSAPPPRKQQLTLWAPTPPGTITADFVFFFPDWIERIPSCSTLDDLKDVIEPLMRFIGLHVSRDPMFVTKFTRLGRTHLITTWPDNLNLTQVPIDPTTKKPSGDPDPDHPIRQFWLKVLRLYLLPALPLIRGNAVTTVEVWNIIRQFETTIRWRLYGEWKTTTYQSHPELRIRQVQADRESKGILRRLSHQTIDSLSGPVAKLAHSNPCIFFSVAVGQIMAYDNLANVVIQALRYCTNMGFDVLVFIILDALANPNKERVKDDGVNTTDWLQSLASFTGMLFRRYSADLTSVLKYIVHQLYNGQTTEIIVLREVIWKMAGIEPLPDLSDAQIAAMAGGPTLRVEAVASDTRGARLDPGDAVLKGPQRLGKALLDSSLALPLLIQVAQQRQACVFRAPEAHLKSLASLYDTTHGVLLQYLELLTTPAVVSSADYSQKVLPSLAELGEKYGICAPICMQIVRPMLNGLLLKAALAMQEQEKLANEEEEKRLKAALTAKREAVAVIARVPSPAVGPAPAKDSPVDTPIPVVEVAAKDVKMEVDTSPAPQSPWIPELAAIFDDIKKIAPGNAYDLIGPGFYVTFWQLSTYDLTPPSTRYEEESATLKALSHKEDLLWSAADRSADRTKRLTANSHRARRARYNDYINLLAQEYREQTASRAFTIKRLAKEKHHWFSSRTPGFSTLHCYDKLLGDHVKVVVFSCSEYEARNYGRFLLNILKDLWAWQQSEELYLQDNRAKGTKKAVFHPGMQKKWSMKPNLTQEDILSWTEFKIVLKKWQRKLGKCLLDCIRAGDFMHVYNAIIVLKEILPVFPLAECTEVGPVLDQVMQTFLEKEERGDLKILGRAYAASLKKRENLWAVARPPGPKSGGTPSSPRPSSTPNTSEKPQSTSIPSGPAAKSSSANDSRRSSAIGSTPSAPRAQLASSNGTSQGTGERTSDTRLAMGSVPRPEVVKRVRPDKNSPSPRPESSQTADGMDVDPKAPINGDTRRNGAQSTLRKDISLNSSLPSTGSKREPPQSPRAYRLDSRNDPVMPPPSAPSQTLSAHELRETAKHSIVPRNDKTDDRSRSMNEPRSQNGSRNPSPIPRRRSLSPPTRPGTRNGSADSRASGGRRSDRGSGDGRDERKSDRDSRQTDPHAPSRRDSRSDRSRVRDGDKDGDRDRERDRGRDRHGEKEKDRDRERDRDKDRRDRDRDRDRDRHRRDDKDRDREGRRERDPSRTGSTGGALPSGAPSRPESSRHREGPSGEEGLGKRRRPTDDEVSNNPTKIPARSPVPEVFTHAQPDRSSKRPSRKDGSHREDRSRRSEKDGHDRPPRDSDRRRGDRNGSEVDSRSERSTDKRAENVPLPVSTPSAPRAMAVPSENISRGPPPSSRDRDWKPRDSGPDIIAPSQSQGPDFGGGGGGSLRSRISDKDVGRPANPYNNRPEPPHRDDDDRDGSRKRTAADRDKDSGETNSPAPGADVVLPSKRPRINRTRYQASPGGEAGGNIGLVRRTLPMEPQGVDRSRPPRKD